MSPYVTFKLVNGLVTPGGCLGDIWVLLAKILNLNCTYTLQGQEQRADVVLQGATHLSSIATHLAIVSSWYDFHMEESLASSLTLSYLENWSYQHWYSTIAMAVIFTYSLYFMFKYAIANDMYLKAKSKVEDNLIRKSQWQRHEFWLNNRRKPEAIPGEDRKDVTITDCVLASVSLFSNQGIYVVSRIYAIRLLILSFLLFGMIVTNAYSAMLVSQLTAGSDVSRGLAEQDSMIICMRFNSLPYLDYDGPRNRVRAESSCAKALCAGSAVLETPEIVGTYGSTCRVVVMRKRQYQFKLAIEVMPHAPQTLRHGLQLNLCRLNEVGLLSRFTRKWLVRPDPFSNRGNFHIVSMIQIGGVFTWYAFASIFSVLILLIEILYNRKNSLVNSQYRH